MEAIVRLAYPIYDGTQDGKYDNDPYTRVLKGQKREPIAHHPASSLYNYECVRY